MKVKISYTTVVEKVITVPKKWEFYFEKDEDDFTDAEWDILDNEKFLGLPYEDIDIESIME